VKRGKHQTKPHREERECHQDGSRCLDEQKDGGLSKKTEEIRIIDKTQRMTEPEGRCKKGKRYIYSRGQRKGKQGKEGTQVVRKKINSG